MSITSVGAILLISREPEKLRDFYVDALGLPFEDEIHDDTPLHYGCEIGPVHLAIHPADGWPGTATLDSLSPIVALMTDDISEVVKGLETQGISVEPTDHGFAFVVAFRDPDGNHVEILQEKGGT